MLEPLRNIVLETLGELRIGVYRAVVSGLSSASQVLAVPSWAEGSARMRWVQSPLLDVRPKSGTPLAVASQDGVPSFPLALGQIFEEGAAEAMQAWLRADLDASPDEVELGADAEARVVAPSVLLGDGSRSGVATENTMSAATAGLDVAYGDNLAVLTGLGGSPASGTAVADAVISLKAYIDAMLSSSAYSSVVEAS